MKRILALMIALTLTATSLAEPNLRRKLHDTDEKIHIDPLAWAFGISGFIFEIGALYFLGQHCRHKAWTPISNDESCCKMGYGGHALTFGGAGMLLLGSAALMSYEDTSEQDEDG